MRSKRTGRAVVITKNGKPVADLVPHRSKKKNALGIWKDKVFVISPIAVEREALK